MSTSRTPRNIHPFGDGKPTRRMDDYLLDCRAYATDSALEQTARDLWRDIGLVVLANTGMRHLSELERWARVICTDFTSYNGGSAPRAKWSETVFSVDDTPAHIDMCFHNEACYLAQVPRCFVIGSLACPSEGGETLVSDNQVTTDAILDTAVGRALLAKGVRYVRNMTDRDAGEPIAYKHWQETFFTDSRAEAERKVREQGWDYQWLDNGTLRAAYTVDAFEFNTQLGRDLFFAGLVSHAAFFDSWRPFNTLPDEARAFTMLLGDGTPLSNDDISRIYAAYNQAYLAIDWRRADVALIDNERWTHARPAFALKDSERRIMGVTLGMMKDRVGSRRSTTERPSP